MRLAPGLALAGAGGLVGVGVHHAAPSVSAHVVAVLIGVVAGNALPATGVLAARLRPGLRAAARTVLRLGVVALGFRLSLGQVLDLGPRALVAVVAVVVVTFVGTQHLGRRLGVGRGLSFLVATGYSICGASAVAAAEPFADAKEEEVAYALGLVTVCGSLAILVLPPLGQVLGLGPHDFGAWIGASVHDVGQVVAAASTADAEAVEAAVVVKLTRVALLAPLLALVALRHRRHAGPPAATSARRPPLLPWFVAAFIGASALRSAGAVPEGWLGGIRELETLLLAAGLVGLGSGVLLARLRGIGPRPLLLGLVAWVLVAGVALGAVGLTSG